jgi:hypothetical protein
MGKIVISQPMYFPWPGIFEQIKLADAFVYYDDVQFPQGQSFINRVQLKTPTGPIWMSIPVKGKHKDLQNINQVEVDDSRNWREDHKKKFYFNYATAPYYKDAASLLSGVLDKKNNNLSDIAVHSIQLCSEYLGLHPKFFYSSKLNILGKSTERLVNIVRHFEGKTYITGHGAKNYLDYNLFEEQGITVEYIDYQKKNYPQLWGKFTPYVSVLDLIANMGKEAVHCLVSNSVYWKDFIKN